MPRINAIIFSIVNNYAINRNNIELWNHQIELDLNKKAYYSVGFNQQIKLN